MGNDEGTFRSMLTSKSWQEKRSSFRLPPPPVDLTAGPAMSLTGPSFAAAAWALAASAISLSRTHFGLSALYLFRFNKKRKSFKNNYPDRFSIQTTFPKSTKIFGDFGESTKIFVDFGKIYEDFRRFFAKRLRKYLRSFS